jgi:hypothetical protein
MRYIKISNDDAKWFDETHNRPINESYIDGAFIYDTKDHTIAKFPSIETRDNFMDIANKLYAPSEEHISKENFIVKPTDKQNAIQMIIKNHYLHRKCSCLYAFGLYDLFDNLYGVCIFGMPASRFLQKGICGENEANHVMELTRLWIDDSVGKNAESFLVSQSLKWLKANNCTYDIIVSFSDTEVGHCGYIYQACNFLYTGQNHIQKDWIVDGKKLHNRHFIDRFGSVKQAKEYYGDRMVQVERSIKYRYIYFNCNKTRKKELMKELRYNILPYPKKYEGV